MAIDFSEKTNKNSINTNKIIIIVVFLVLAVVAFLFFKNGGFNSGEIKEQPQMFQPINIDLDFISSLEFKNLENFRGIPVLPGFFEASETVTQAEKIEYGRQNPFMTVSQEEIELAITKAIQKITTFEEIEEMRNLIQNSTLYTTSQKNSLILKLEDQKKVLEHILEQEMEGEEIILIEEENTEGTIELIEEEEIVDYYKEW